MLNEEIIDSLIESAAAAAEKAYVPYSAFPVGAAIITEDERVFTGTNIENAAFGCTICAERVAIYKAVSEGYSNFAAIAIYNENTLPFPCGVCRQVLAEFVDDLIIVVASDYSVKSCNLKELLPYKFKGDF